MGNRIRSPPVPVLVAPKLSGFIPASSHEIEILLVRYLILADLKFRYMNGMGLELVVPAEGFSGARETQGRRAGGNLDHPVAEWCVFENG